MQKQKGQLQITVTPNEDARKIEIDQGKMGYINFAYNEEINYSKKAALARVLNEREEKELVNLAVAFSRLNLRKL